MARASYATLLSLDRYAKIIGINPLHFNGALTPSLNPAIFPNSNCSAVWFQHDWQYVDKVGRENLAQAISEAEYEIASTLNYWPAPMWIASERHRYTRPYRRDAIGLGLDIRWRTKSVVADYGKLIEFGRRGVALIGTYTTGVGGGLTYTDVDTDLFYETATVTLVIPTTDICNYKVYFAGHNGEPEWEIRDPKSKTLVAGTLTIKFESWKFIDPDLWEAYPTSDGVSAIDVSTTSNFVTSVQVYYEYTDHALPSSTFYWESTAFTCAYCGGSGCDHCAPLYQDGCAFVRDSHSGECSAFPATYDAATGEWTSANWSVGYEPDYVDLWYLAGDRSNLFQQGRSCDPLSLQMANAIAWLATARLDRPICDCGNSGNLVDRLREDLAMSSSTGPRYTVSYRMLDNPFGTRRGEVMAWNLISKVFDQVMHVAVI